MIIIVNHCSATVLMSENICSRDVCAWEHVHKIRVQNTLITRGPVLCAALPNQRTTSAMQSMCHTIIHPICYEQIHYVSANFLWVNYLVELGSVGKILEHRILSRHTTARKKKIMSMNLLRIEKCNDHADCGGRSIGPLKVQNIF